MFNCVYTALLYFLKYVMLFYLIFFLNRDYLKYLSNYLEWNLFVVPWYSDILQSISVTI